MLELAQLVEYFHFLRPQWGALLPLFFAIRWVMRKRQRSLALFGGIIAPHLLEHLRLNHFANRLINPDSVSTVFSILLILILMGPSWRQQPSPLSEDTSALVILLDASQSMDLNDVQPSRLQRAKQKIGELLAMRADKRAALIVYAGSAHTVLSLTGDRDILDQYLAAIEPGIMPRPGKFPEYALPLIDEVLRESSAPATITLFTDGLGSASESAFESYFDSHAHQLVVVGMGSDRAIEGMPPLEKAALQSLASATGGSYINLSIDDTDMKQVNRRINSHYVVIEDEALPWLDSGYGLVFPALVLFLLWFRKGWTLTWLWLLVPLAFAPASTQTYAQDETPTAATTSSSHWFANLWLTPDQHGRLLLQLGRYEDAALRFRDPQWKGLAYYYAEDFMLSAEYFARSDTADALFNEANARAQARDYMRSVNRYDRLLAQVPDYPGAAENRATVQALIDAINRMSESQQAEGGVEGSNELSNDDAIPATGAEEQTWQQAELVQLSAQEILEDPDTAAMWLRGVQQNPSDFLASKFSMQLNNNEATTEREETE
ncbi:MAG: VWA domain-containing protein [Halioglobus sp.]